jgi:hypothetical protein
MKARNVIISLFFVLALFVFGFMKIRLEPRRKMIFNRNLSKVEYSQFALCQMNCQQMTANDITYILRNGEVVSKARERSKQPCQTYTLRGKTKIGLDITVIVIQCGRASKILKCYRNVHSVSCECKDEDIIPVSFIKTKTNAFPA